MIGARDLTKRYGGTLAVQGLSFRVDITEPGDLRAVTALRGAGSSPGGRRRG